jgi:hypothetical protein
MRHTLVVIVILLPIAAAAARDPSDHGPHAVGFTRRTYTKPSETTGQPRALDTYIACLPEFCGVGCEPGALSLADAQRVTLRWAVPFLLRYVAQKPAFGKLLRAGPGDSDVVVESGRRSTRGAP